MSKTKHPDLLNAIVDMQESIAYAARKNVLLMAEAVIVSLEAENAQLKAELSQAKHAEQQIREHEFHRGYQEAEAQYKARLDKWERVELLDKEVFAKAPAELTAEFYHRANNVARQMEERWKLAKAREARLVECLQKGLGPFVDDPGGYEAWYGEATVLVQEEGS